MVGTAEEVRFGGPPLVVARSVTDLRQSWAWNSSTMEAAVRACGIDTRRTAPDRFVADGLRWFHTADPHLTAPVRSKATQRARLAAADVPTADGIVCSNARDAVAWASSRFPVVVKPARGSKGGGVAAGLTTPRQVERAARGCRGTIIVERLLTGPELRILATDDRPLAACLRTPPTVTGDGRSTLRQLVEAANRRARSPVSEVAPLPAGQRAVSVPDVGQVVVVSLVANVSMGGISHDVTDRLAGDLATAGAVAVAAVAALGYGHGGVDLIGDTVLEVNHAASLRVHLHPSIGLPRRVDLDLAARYHR